MILSSREDRPSTAIPLRSVLSWRSVSDCLRPPVQNIREIRENSVILERQLEDGYGPGNSAAVRSHCGERTEPAEIYVCHRHRKAYEKEITIGDERDLGISVRRTGSASPTKVFRSFTPPPKGKGEMLAGTVNEMAQSLVSKLWEKHVL